MKIKDILASVGLPNTAAGKKKFYEMYPDEDSYKMAMGGPISSIVGGLGYPYGLMQFGGLSTSDETEYSGAPRDVSLFNSFRSAMSGDDYVNDPANAGKPHAEGFWGSGDGNSGMARGPMFKYGGLPGGAHDVPCMNCGGYMIQGGTMTADLEGTYPVFNTGGQDLSMSDFRKYLGRVKKEGGASFPGEGEQDIIAKRKGEFLQTLTDNYDNHIINSMQEEGLFAKGGFQDNSMNALMSFLAQRAQGDGYTYMPYNQRGYSLGNKDLARFSKLPASTQFQGISKVNYGVLPRIFPKLRNVIGPKSIEFNTRNAYEDNLKPQPTDEASVRKMLKMGKQKKSNYQGPYPEAEETSPQNTSVQNGSYELPDFFRENLRASQVGEMGNINSPINMNQPNNITLNPTYTQFGLAPKVGPLAEHAYGGFPKYIEGGPGLPAYGANRTGPSTQENQWMADDLNAGASNLKSNTNPAALFQNYLNTDPILQQKKKDDELLRNPATNNPYEDNTFKLKKDPWGEQEAILLNTIGQGLTAFNEAGQRRRSAFDRSKTSTFGTTDAEQAGVDFRGDYSKMAGQASGMFRYDQDVPVQRTGQSFKTDSIVKYGGDPFYKGGGSAPSANFWTASQINKAAQAFEYSEPDIDVNHTLGPVDREHANLEAEGGETAIVDVKGIPTHFDIKGPRHTEGGVPLNLPEDSFIFSDTKKMMVKGGDVLKQFGMSLKKSGYTPADIAKKVTGGKYDMNYYRGVLADKDSDPLQRKTAETMIANYNLKLAKLGLVQESMKGFPQGIPKIAEPWMTAMSINPTDLIQPQGQQLQPDGDMTAKFGGNLPKAQDGYVEGKPAKISKYEPFWGGEEWVKFDQPITMPDGDVLYELPQSEWNKFQEQGYLDVAGAPFGRGTFRDVASNPWGGDFIPGNSPKSYRINTKQPGKVVQGSNQVPVGTQYKEGNKTYKVVATDRYEDGQPAYKVKETSDPDKNISSYFSSYMGNKVVPAKEVISKTKWDPNAVKDKAYAREMAEWEKRSKATNVATAHEALEDIGTATQAEIDYLKSKGHKFIANGKTY